MLGKSPAGAFIQNIAQPSWIGISKGMADLNSYEFISRYAKKTPRHLETVAADSRTLRRQQYT